MTGPVILRDLLAAGRDDAVALSAPGAADLSYGALLAPLAAGGAVYCTPGFNALKFFGWLGLPAPTGIAPFRPCIKRYWRGQRRTYG